MIENRVKKVFGDQDDTDHLFWIDTFAIPQNRDNNPRRARLKRRAIGLIHHIFHEAKHCIIIDRHILERSKSFYDCRTIGAMLLACGWMMRLWTLQEAFVSAKLHLAMRDRNDDNFRNSVPPGMIFLPGKRLPFPGFGWAPLTSMSGQDEAYPYPLDNPEHPTTLNQDRGLVVRYPGFLLHLTREKLKEIITVRKSFDFSVNRRLDEWYRVRAANRKIQPDDDSLGAEGKTGDDARLVAQYLRTRMEENKAVKIAIILSRPRPVEVTGEIGLLVEVCQDDAWSSGSQTPPREQQLLYCKIIHRVEVSRHLVSRAESCPCEEGEPTTPEYGPIINRFYKFKQEGIAGVQLPNLQEWCVDGYPHLQMPESSMPSPRPEDTAPSPEQATGMLGRLRRSLTSGVTRLGG
ncbi:hypothetical protein NCS57_00350200 [Fusarium keratoplasticum]|uniref:Uncharacterized protein n=1 Tax=Fusarium keratoplasticum TaxID=1328300 RepID=A0ACC0R4N0_9HYPO|nr:hypothetical protein NCS57_00350200 [Fusarium keratoplasticum]KAI8674522.1 hypothetical protein NCS57_00350200 [Fusarium keratoplasticum]